MITHWTSTWSWDKVNRCLLYQNRPCGVRQQAAQASDRPANRPARPACSGATSATVCTGQTGEVVANYREPCWTRHRCAQSQPILYSALTAWSLFRHKRRMELVELSGRTTGRLGYTWPTTAYAVGGTATLLLRYSIITATTAASTCMTGIMQNCKLSHFYRLEGSVLFPESPVGPEGKRHPRQPGCAEGGAVRECDCNTPQPCPRGRVLRAPLPDEDASPSEEDSWTPDLGQDAHWTSAYRSPFPRRRV